MAPLKAMCVLALVPALIPAQSTPQQTAPGQNQQPKEKCVVTGRVVNALTGEPIKKARVHLDYANRQSRMSGPRGYGGAGGCHWQFSLRRG
jgi:hypothetical protein